MQKCQLLYFNVTRFQEWVCIVNTDNKQTKEEVFLRKHLTAEPRGEKPSMLLAYRLDVKNLLLSGTKVNSEEFKPSNTDNRLSCHNHLHDSF